MNCCSSIFRRRGGSKRAAALNHEDIPGVESVEIFSYQDLRTATQNFSLENKIGEGGFGSVYKGSLRDGRAVAVKVLSPESRQGLREFLTELIVISSIVHENLVRLYGCCVDRNQRILVYEYLVNNSLAQTLLGSSLQSIHFSWKDRTKICIGIARALAFLHEEVRPHVVHRDIKASNILLGKDLTPKISDFGLAKLLPANMTHISTKVAGTLGYLAPEYAFRGKLTRKADIYSFGVLLLEIVSGRCNTNKRLPYEDRFLLERIWALYEHGKLTDIVDTSLDDDFDADEACRILMVGLLCTQDAPSKRPTMSAVVKILTGEAPIDQEITKPGLISDVMDMKVQSPKKLGEAQTTSTMSPLSEMTSHGSITFTTITDCE